MIIELYRNESLQLVNTFTCDNESVIELLGEPQHVLAGGLVMYYDYGGDYRLVVDRSGE